MSSLTTFLVVGPNEYVEFNESWGSKAFLHHIWDQAQTPLDTNDLAQGRLHSAGARISKANPPRIEFPIVLRVKGKGSTYKATGKWLAWDDLAALNPLAVTPPPSLDDFIAAGATVGTGPKLKPGEFASKNDPIDHIKPSTSKSTKLAKTTKAKTPIMDLETDEDGWIGGSSQSIYAQTSQPSSHASPPPAAKPANKPSPVTPGREKSQPGDTKSRSLLERMDMAQNLQTPPPKARNREQDSTCCVSTSSTPSPASNPATSPFRATPSQGIRRPGAKIPSPLPLTSPARNNGTVSPLNTRTPLSASHPFPETPLKLSQRGGPQTPATPHYSSYPHSSHAYAQDGDAARASGLGLGLTPLKTSVPLVPSPDNVRSPLNEALNLRGRAASNASIESPLKSGRYDLHGEPFALGSASSSKAGNGQIDAMLDRLRNSRSGLGTSASMWAPKPASDSTPLTSAASHTIGSGFSSSNLLGVQTGLIRKRPSHRPNGLQLSLGQEISVMQELEEKAEEDYAPSNLSSANVSETFRIDPPDHEPENGDQDGWHGNVVPPTPALGCDSSSSDGETGATKAPSRSLDAFGWGSHASETRQSSLFSKLPSSSTLEANWSGDDDDERKDDVEVFEDMQSRAKASGKEKRNNSSYAPLPPPPINYAKSRTPSPTHHLLAKSPQLDGPVDGGNRSFGSPSLGAPRFRTSSSGAEAASKASGQRLSPVSARSQLPSEDSDGDADVEAERPTQRKTSKKHEVKPTPVSTEEDHKPSKLHFECGGLEKRRSLKRDKSERIRGRRASQSKEKDVDKVKVSATAPTVATANVSLPTSTFVKNTDDLVRGIENVNLGANKDKPDRSNHVAASSEGASEHKSIQESQQTPVANRIQSVPAVKDDLFSSPSEPKVELPNTSATEPALAAEASPELVVKVKEEAVPKTPEPSHPKTMSFDWAADDDELDDELPDLDDWGVTLTPANPGTSSVEVESGAAKGSEKPARNGKASKIEEAGEKPWRRGGLLDAMSKNKPKDAASKESNSRRGKASRELFPAPSIKGSAGTGEPFGPLGIRIAGRAKEASLSPETEPAPMFGKGKGPNLAPPASTPYGRWKTQSQGQADELTIKGSTGNRKAPPSKKEESGKTRPRIAADLGALAKLLTPVEEAPSRSAGKQSGDKGRDASRKIPPAVEKAEEAAGKKGLVGESKHAPPSVADSMHAPKSRPATTGSAPPTGPRGGVKKKSHGGRR